MMSEGVGFRTSRIPRRVRMHYIHPTCSSSELRNIGAEIAKAPLIYFLDDDCLLSNSKVLENFLNSIRPGEHAWCASYASHQKSSRVGHVYNKICNIWLKSRLENGLSPSFLGGNFAIKKTLWSDLSLNFNPYLLQGGEELELSHGLRQNGFPIFYKASMEVSHLSLHSLKSFFQRAWGHGQSPAREHQKNFSLQKSMALLPWNIFDLTLIFSYFVLTRSAYYFQTTSKLRQWHTKDGSVSKVSLPSIPA